MKFKRQHSIEKFIVDFYCDELKLIKEVDGSVHENLGQANYDHERDEYLKLLGYFMYRVDNDSVIYYCPVVLENLKETTDSLRRR
ncbi:endonuclease domain-containing protein [Pedobacter sp. SYSU D00535]|uniref:endonuclease domain-containing protein n=1 Tax=Pedobacter sp. SYSU D00535 TaxID=2810308 RepID=UPI001F619835|nr:DUF559 domain-containing protein [Pedobacter sp. SYSU D00535]